VPDEVFYRIRGALFFGPEFLVTRNKLSFRDNLIQLLQHATSGAFVTFTSFCCLANLPLLCNPAVTICPCQLKWASFGVHPAERSSLERKFKEWLTRCHSELDKNIRFECMSDSGTQVCQALGCTLCASLKSFVDGSLPENAVPSSLHDYDTNKPK
jgi:structural maintenance of chromosomes flexible hinge domain-containing protein 1